MPIIAPDVDFVVGVVAFENRRVAIILQHLLILRLVVDKVVNMTILIRENLAVVASRVAVRCLRLAAVFLIRGRRCPLSVHILCNYDKV